MREGSRVGREARALLHEGYQLQNKAAIIQYNMKKPQQSAGKRGLQMDKMSGRHAGRQIRSRANT